jgi:hypothetical protein
MYVWEKVRRLEGRDYSNGYTEDEKYKSDHEVL